MGQAWHCIPKVYDILVSPVCWWVRTWVETWGKTRNWLASGERDLRHIYLDIIESEPIPTPWDNHGIIMAKVAPMVLKHHGIIMDKLASMVLTINCHNSLYGLHIWIKGCEVSWGATLPKTWVTCQGTWKPQCIGRHDKAQNILWLLGLSIYTQPHNPANIGLQLTPWEQLGYTINLDN